MEISVETIDDGITCAVLSGELDIDAAVSPRRTISMLKATTSGRSTDLKSYQAVSLKI
jgi:hypothetical protein